MSAKGQVPSSNFGFLAKRYPQLERIGARGELYFSDDPVVTLISVRQFGEVLAQLVAARTGLLSDGIEAQADLLRRLRVDGNYPRSVLDLFHQLRIEGNAATHRGEGDHATALACLKMARQLGIWFYRTFDDHDFKAGPFQPPRPPVDATVELTAELKPFSAGRSGFALGLKFGIDDMEAVGTEIVLAPGATNEGALAMAGYRYRRSQTQTQKRVRCH